MEKQVLTTAYYTMTKKALYFNFSPGNLQTWQLWQYENKHKVSRRKNIIIVGGINRKKALK